MVDAECRFSGLPGDLVRFGPTLKVQIGLDVSYRPESGGAPNLPPTEYPALVDTGALASCIDSAVALALDLPVIDEQSISGAHGSGRVNVHLAHIHVPTLGFTQYGGFFGAHLLAGGQPHHALLGRTLLRNMTMVYDGSTGTVSIRR